MLNKWQGYVLNVQGVVCWRRIIDEYGQIIFVKTKITSPEELYIEKLKSQNISGNSIDVITGRIFRIIIHEDSIMLLPSGITLNRNCLIEHHNVFSKGLTVLEDEDKDKKYKELSEDIIINSYFCEKISNELGLSVIPESLLERETENFRKTTNIKLAREK